MKKLQLIITLFLFLGNINAQVTADFSATSTLGCGGLIVDFTDLSSTSNSSIVSWTWDFGDGGSSNLQNPAWNYQASGMFTVCLTATDDQGANDQNCKSDFITVDPAPVCLINPSIPVLNCSVTEVVLDGLSSSTGPNFAYLWTTTNGNIVSGATTLTPTVDEPGTYTLEVTETNTGCSSNASISVVENITLPISDAGPTGVITCNNASVILDGSGSSQGPNFTYAWMTNGSNISNTINVEVFQAGTYELIVTDNSNGCTALSTTIVVEDTTLPNMSAIISSTTVCNGDPVVIDMIPVCSNCLIEIFDGNNNLVCTAFPCMLDPNLAPFTVILTNANGCSDSATFNISQTSPILFSSIITDASCFGGSDGAVDISVSGGTLPYIYTWSNGETTEDPTSLQSGTYHVTIVDANGCTITENVTISEPPLLEITSVDITNASCLGPADGAIDITLNGGTPPYFFHWSNGATSEDIFDLVPDFYQVDITDNNGCFFQSIDYEVLPAANLIQNISNDTTICAGESLQLFVDAPGAVSYEWVPTNGLSDPTISSPIAAPTEPITYTITITDGNGCSDVDFITIDIQTYIDFNLLQFSNSPICEDSTLELYANQGTSFLWTGPNGFTSTEENPVLPNITVGGSGMYSVTITDDFDCTANASTDVFIDDDCVWAGDTDTNKVVNNFDLLNIGLAFDSTGTPRQNASFDWFAQPSLDWMQSTPTSGVNFKHIDTNGDGVVNSADTFAITQNWGEVHNFTDDTPINQFTDLPPTTDDALLMIPFYIEPDTLIEGETIALEIILGDMSNVVTGLYGIAFSIEYDTAVVVPGSAKIDFNNCWLGDVNADAISIQQDFSVDGRIDAAITRIDGMEMDGFGFFGDFIITLEDDILLWDDKNDEPENDVFADFSITNYHLINFSQQEIPVEAITTTAPVDSIGTTGADNWFLEKNIRLYPNPAKEGFYISAKEMTIEKIRIYDVVGKLMTTETKTMTDFFVKTNDFYEGVYFVEIQTDRGVLMKKVSVLR